MEAKKKQNIIYWSIVNLCEDMEGKDFSGHQLAQKIARLVVISQLSINQKKLYDALEDYPQTSKELSKKTGIESKNISTIVAQIADTGLVYVNRDVFPHQYAKSS